MREEGPASIGGRPRVRRDICSRGSRVRGEWVGGKVFSLRGVRPGPQGGLPKV